MSRGVVAALLAAAVVLSGCGTGDGEDSAASPSAEAPVNPWDLPLEERPDLFDPCTEIPVEAIEEAVGGPVEPDELLHNHRPKELHTCGWKNDELIFIVTSTWRSKQGFLTHTGFGPFDTESIVEGRAGYRARDRDDSSNDTCYQVFFTSRGAVVVNVNLIDPFNVFHGSRNSDACTVLDQTIGSIIDDLPAEDY